MIGNTESDISYENYVTEQASNVAVVAAVQASQHILTYWPNPTNPYFNRALVMEIFEKSQGTGNYATIADIESESIILGVIRQNPLFKDYHITGEESEEVAGEATPVKGEWVIDPIDGTPPFRNGLPEFGISIGLLRREPVMGVIALPALQQLIVARKGQGAKLLSFDGRVLADLSQMSGAEALSLDKMLVAYDLGYKGRGKQLQEIVAKLADRVGYPVSYGSCSVGNFRLALGSIGAYFFQTPTKFDIAAANAIIPEIGGVVTDITGNPIDWNATTPQSYLAARSPQIHKQVLEIINN